MSDDELIQKGKVYKQLVDFPPWKVLVEEMQSICKNLKDIAADDFIDLRLKEKGMRAGIKQMIDTPLEAIAEMEEILTEREDA